MVALILIPLNTPQTILSSPHGASNVSFADFDQNGHNDFYLAPDDDVIDMGQSHMALNNGSDYTVEESIDFRPENESPTADTFRAYAFAYDVNLDGKMDLVTHQYELRGGQVTVEVYWGDGTGSFTLPSEVLLDYNYNEPQIPSVAWGALKPSSTCYQLTLTRIGSGKLPTVSPAQSTGCAKNHYIAGEFIQLNARPATQRAACH